MFVCYECCVLSGRGLCEGLITHPGESYRLWSVVVCDQETSKMRKLKPATGLCKIQPKGCNARKTNKQQTVLEYFSRHLIYCLYLNNNLACILAIIHQQTAPYICFSTYFYLPLFQATDKISVFLLYFLPQLKQLARQNPEVHFNHSQFPCLP
jgi:hypothetical protein